MADYGNLARRSWTRRFTWYSQSDVLEAFHIVAQEIRNKLHAHAARPIMLSEACELAWRIKEQRELLRQLVDRRDTRHLRRLLHLNRRLRDRLLALVARAGLDPTVLILR